MDVRRVESLKSGNDIIGNHTRVKVVKNKVAPPFKQAEFDIMYGEGISHEGCLVDLGVQYNILNKSGAWYSYGDQRIGQGRENTKTFLKEHPDMLLKWKPKSGPQPACRQTANRSRSRKRPRNRKNW